MDQFLECVSRVEAEHQVSLHDLLGCSKTEVVTTIANESLAVLRDKLVPKVYASNVLMLRRRGTFPLFFCTLTKDTALTCYPPPPPEPVRLKLETSVQPVQHLMEAALWESNEDYVLHQCFPDKQPWASISSFLDQHVRPLHENYQSLRPELQSFVESNCKDSAHFYVSLWEQPPGLKVTAYQVDSAQDNCPIMI